MGVREVWRRVFIVCVYVCVCVCIEGGFSVCVCIEGGI